MKSIRASLVVLFSLLVAVPAFADWDGTTEAQEQARREAAIKANQEKQRQADQLKREQQKKADASLVEAKRQTLGESAKGKSDAEVEAMYDAKVKQDQKNAAEAVTKARAGLGTTQGTAATRQVTGKSLSEIENMSDAELEAMGRELERKYGGGGQ